MIKITPGEFYRLWILARDGHEALYAKSGPSAYQSERQSDQELIEKCHILFELGVTAEFQTRQVSE